MSASALVKWDELKQEDAPLPPGFKDKDGLIQYTVTPVKDPSTQDIIGALIAGDLVSGKLAVVEQTLDAFSGGYSAIYMRQPSGKFELATALKQADGSPERDVALENLSLVEQAAAAPGKLRTQRAKVGAHPFTLAATAVTDSKRQPIAVLVRGTPEATLDALINNSLMWQLGVATVAAFVAIALSALLRRAIVRPIVELKQAAQDYAEGDRDTRAPVLAPPTKWVSWQKPSIPWRTTLTPLRTPWKPNPTNGKQRLKSNGTKRNASRKG